MEVFIAQGEPGDALTNPGPDGVLEGVGVAMVGEAGGALGEGAGAAFGFAAAPGAARGGDGATSEAGVYGARAEGLESHRRGGTRCRQEAVSGTRGERAGAKPVTLPEAASFCSPGEKSGLGPCWKKC